MLLCIWVHTFFFWKSEVDKFSSIYSKIFSMWCCCDCDWVSNESVSCCALLNPAYCCLICGWHCFRVFISVFLQTLLLYLGDKPKSETFRADEQCYPIAKKDGRTVKLLVSFWVITDSSSVGLLSLGTGLMCYLKLPLQLNVIKERFL